MCGIVGAVSGAPVDMGLIERMRDLLGHRGPDHAGAWQSADGRVGFGHRRLAIVDLVPESNQPFVSSDGRYVMTFNGEIYNFQTLRGELQQRRVVFRTQSDTEVLLEAYRAWGAGCLERLSGQFAFAIWDAAARRLFCARDRAGEKPFYYSLIGDSFVFASELKALLLWPGFQKALHYPALVDFLTLGFVADPKTIWEGSFKLPPAHSMVVDLTAEGRVVAHDPLPYWDMEFDPDYSVGDWGPTILETLQFASQEMAFADVPVGTFLSGGVDSSSVTAALARAGCPVQAFTIGFEEETHDERPWARQVAEQYGTPHTERVVKADDVTAVFDKMIWHYDEPFNDYSYLPTYYVCREARKVITVALSGDGGDEVFAGYRKYQRLGMRAEVERFMPRPVGQLVAAGANLLVRPDSPTRRTLAQYTLPAEPMLADMLTMGLSLPELRAAARGPLATALKHYTPMDAIQPIIDKAPPEKVGLINTMRYLDLKLTLAGDILVKVDRASMAVALEVRPVYLHRDLLKLAGRIPPAQLAGRNHAKEALKSALKAWLPEALLYRRKQGFAMPLKDWLGGDLQQFAGSHPALDGLLDGARLGQTLNGHADGKTDRTAVIHSLFFLKHWLERWN